MALQHIPTTILCNYAEITSFIEDLLVSLAKQSGLKTTYSLSLHIGIHTDSRIGSLDQSLKKKLNASGLRHTITYFPKGLGYGTKQNMLFRKICETQGEFKWFLMLNPDMILHKDCVQNLINFADQKKDAFVIEARQFPFENPPRVYNYDTGEISWCSGAAILTRRSFFEKINGFDENIFLYCEDVDLSWQAFLHAGNCYFCNNAIAAHLTKGYFEDSDFIHVSNVTFMDGLFRSHLILNRKYFGNAVDRKHYDRHLELFWDYPWGTPYQKKLIFESFSDKASEIIPVDYGPSGRPEQIKIHNIGLFHSQRHLI